MKSDAETVLSFRLPKKLLKAFDKVARANGRKRPEQLRWVMRQAVEQQQRARV